MRHQRRHAVVAQSARVNSRWHKGAAQRVHLDQRRQVAGIAKIVGESALGQAGTSRGFHGHHARAALSLDLAAQIGHHQTREIGSAARATDDHVGFVAGQAHLLDRLLPDHGLVQQDVIQHAAQRVLGVRVLGSHFNRLRDGDAQRAVGLRILRQNRAARLCLIARAGGDGRAERLHQCAAVGLLVVAHPHHVDLAFQAEERAGHRQRRAPLARLQSRWQDAWSLPSCCNTLAPRQCSAYASPRG